MKLERMHRECEIILSEMLKLSQRKQESLCWNLQKVDRFQGTYRYGILQLNIKCICLNLLHMEATLIH